jgi:uncharacterized protein
MMTAFLDSVGLLAIWDEDDQWHERATKAYSQLAREKAVLYSSTFVLAECGNTASRYSHRLEPDLLRARLEEMGTLIFPTSDDWSIAWAAYRRSEAGAAGIVDQISFAVMRRLGVTRAFTNDKHFRAAGLEPLF